MPKSDEPLPVPPAVTFTTATNSGPISGSLKRAIEQETAYLDPNTKAALMFGAELKDGKPVAVVAFVMKTRDNWSASLYAKSDFSSPPEVGIKVMHEWKY